ncbi:phosphoadenylyl-sulfate reductase [Microlunatus elymi]|uniref:Adenosine 5'-phosphosulfate reductase n=1 Tax=Microlunatus elymi TaxID=2596828 RepID=A0A516Q5R2_9ACTN|nr:phosphoadenylyl-sulfate reductase [Microlunatus elymi]QDP98773.1 phosphoadenylyl-sulfate reductase [Microlunatus elymi]
MSPAELEALAERAGRELEGAPAEEIMAWAFARFGRRLAVTSSMADTVMIHLAERTAPGLDVIFLDTGYHFVETIGTRDAVEQVFDVNVINVTPELTVAQQDAKYGKDLFASNPDLCCAMRKVEPLGRALQPYKAWATGVRRADNARRAGTKVVGYDRAKKLVKIAPIAAWSDDEVATYIDDHGLISNPLLADGYPSIGCEPCTSRPIDGSDPRSGRWAGRGKTECGIQL